MQNCRRQRRIGLVAGFRVVVLSNWSTQTQKSIDSTFAKRTKTISPAFPAERYRWYRMPLILHTMWKLVRSINRAMAFFKFKYL